jgi:hypothetical protein
MEDEPGFLQHLAAERLHDDRIERPKRLSLSLLLMPAVYAAYPKLAPD